MGLVTGRVEATTPLIGGHVGEVIAVGENTHVSPVRLGQRVRALLP
jgi:D-arabinose 1-dehydrogenase-like Zn-dependent alcohol dehydrogenase